MERRWKQSSHNTTKLNHLLVPLHAHYSYCTARPVASIHQQHATPASAPCIVLHQIVHLNNENTNLLAPLTAIARVTMASSSLASTLSSLLTCLLFAATLLLILPSSPLVPVQSSNICICECCEGGARCGSNNTQAYTIYDTCSGCTRDFCVESYEPCRAEQTRLDVIANCVNRDRWVNPAVIVVFLLTVTSLVALGIAKNFVRLTPHTHSTAARRAPKRCTALQCFVPLTRLCWRMCAVLFVESSAEALHPQGRLKDAPIPSWPPTRGGSRCCHAFVICNIAVHSLSARANITCTTAPLGCIFTFRRQVSRACLLRCCHAYSKLSVQLLLYLDRLTRSEVQWQPTMGMNHTTYRMKEKKGAHSLQPHPTLFT